MSGQTVEDLPEDAARVLEFWFEELAPKQWWTPDQGVDAVIAEQFATLYESLADAVPGSWLAQPESCLAVVIVLDQFPRNLFRDDARAYASDDKALSVAHDTIEKGWDKDITPVQRAFLYMPFQHSEDREDQARSVALFESLGDEDSLEFAKTHKEIIDRFGRFPHRNKVLGRTSTPEEREFLKGPALFW